MTPTRARRRGLPLALGASLLLAACGSGDPLEEEDQGGGQTDGSGGSSTVVVGSQDYYSNEILAEIYARALEAEGLDVERNLRIGQRDVYLQAMEAGEVDLIPEYTGNLLQFYDAETTARSPEEVASELPGVLPDGLTVLDYAEAEDADSYNVTTEFSEEHGITSLADLAAYDGEITIGGNAELESRPYGPDGLHEFYGIEVGFVAIGDSGGPLTKGAILDGTITMGDIYTADPDLAGGDFVTLEDPENMILAQNVVPLVSEEHADAVAGTLDAVSAELTTEVLIELNVRSVEDEESAAAIAAEWLAEVGLA